MDIEKMKKDSMNYIYVYIVQNCVLLFKELLSISLNEQNGV